jgi:tRNA dimethylallyltransferase
MKKPMVILTGPTAAGKTNLSIGLAKAINGAVISADSMQVYKKMDIGTAKIMPEEMQGVDHYLVDVLDPFEDFHVARFQQMAKEALEQIYAKGQIPIVVGGTGFYIQALLYDIQFADTKKDDTYRKELEKIAHEKGNHYLHEMLQKIDPKGAEAIHENNVKRVIRALEYFKETGEPISKHNERERSRTSPYQSAYFVLTH